MGSRRRIKYINLRSQKEYSFEEDWEIQEFKSVVYDSLTKNFFVVANKMDDKIGNFIFNFHEENTNKNKVNFVFKQETKLEIGDVDVFFLEQELKTDLHVHELIVGFKTIYLNIYNTICFDITHPENIRNLTVYRHESF